MRLSGSICKWNGAGNRAIATMQFGTVAAVYVRLTTRFSKKKKKNQALSFSVFHPSPDSVFIFLFSHTPFLQAFFFIHPPQFHILTQLKPTKKKKTSFGGRNSKGKKSIVAKLVVHSPMSSARCPCTTSKSEHHEFHSLLCRPVSLML
jgi:hypothetical protein